MRMYFLKIYIFKKSIAFTLDNKISHFNFYESDIVTCFNCIAQYLMNCPFRLLL